MDLNTLNNLTLRQLREQWTELGVRGELPKFKQGLIRRIAWHVQAKAHGGLDAETRRLLKNAIRDAPEPVAKASSPTPIKPNRKRREAVRLRSGTTLVRTWHGHKHRVEVLENGKRYLYRDTEYASLSEIAREITGARWSGPRFFGLNKVRAVA